MDKKRYEEVCFCLDQKEKELNKIEIETFVYDPKIMELVKEIYDLQKEKKELEEELKND